MHTNASILTAHGHTLDAIEHPDLRIPIHSGNQRQGDVLILKVTTAHPGDPIGPKGITVVRAETNTANTHTLVGTGTWSPNPHANRAEQLVQGWVTVPENGEAFLIHTEEHNAIGIGPGTYEIRRQREYAGEWRRVAD
jgi:hypothetical protein